MATNKATVLESLPVDLALLESANRWFDISWYGILFAGSVTALAAFATVGFLFIQFWSSGVKERHTEWRTSILELQTAEAKKDTAAAQEHIASLATEAESARAAIAGANARALEAQLALEKFKAPRTLTVEQQQRIIEKIRPWTGQTVSFSVMADPETVALMQLIRRSLSSAGWTAIASQVGDIEVDGAGIAYGIGVEIQVHPASAQGTKMAGGANALAQALNAEGIAAKAVTNPQLKTVDAINVMVGRKP